MDGYTVARELRTIETMAAVPIVAVTSYAMMGDRQKAIAAGCTGYIEKPINPETFVSQIEDFLPGGPQGREKDP
jgi:CheY-like chemotaxis protein